MQRVQLIHIREWDIDEVGQCLSVWCTHSAKYMGLVSLQVRLRTCGGLHNCLRIDHRQPRNNYVNLLSSRRLQYSFQQFCLVRSFIPQLEWDQSKARFKNILALVEYCIVKAQYVNWNKHPVPVPPSSGLIHNELQHSCVTSCRKSWCESCWYNCNCEGPPIKIHFSIDLSKCYNYNHVIMYTCDCQFH